MTLLRISSVPRSRWIGTNSAERPAIFPLASSEALSNTHTPMNITLQDLLEEETTRPTAIRFVCALKKLLAAADDSDQVFEWSVAVERLQRSWTYEEQKQAFADGKIKAANSTFQERKPPVIIERPEIKPAAPQLSKIKVLEYLKASLKVLKEKDGKTEVLTSSWQDFVAKKHLREGQLCWAVEDSQLTGTQQRWKALVSQALQTLQTDGDIVLRKNPDRWYVFKD